MSKGLQCLDCGYRNQVEYFYQRDARCACGSVHYDGDSNSITGRYEIVGVVPLRTGLCNVSVEDADVRREWTRYGIEPPATQSTRARRPRSIPVTIAEQELLTRTTSAGVRSFEFSGLGASPQWVAGAHDEAFPMPLTRDMEVALSNYTPPDEPDYSDFEDEPEDDE